MCKKLEQCWFTLVIRIYYFLFVNVSSKATSVYHISELRFWLKPDTSVETELGKTFQYWHLTNWVNNKGLSSKRLIPLDEFKPLLWAPFRDVGLWHSFLMSIMPFLEFKPVLQRKMFQDIAGVSALMWNDHCTDICCHLSLWSSVDAWVWSHCFAMRTCPIEPIEAQRHTVPMDWTIWNRFSTVPVLDSHL